VLQVFRPHTDRERAVTERYPDAPKLTSFDQMLDLGAIEPKKACHLIERQPGIDPFETCARRQHRHRHGGNEALPGRRQGGLGGTSACRCRGPTRQGDTPKPGLPGGFLEGQTLMGAEGSGDQVSLERPPPLDRVQLSHRRHKAQPLPVPGQPIEIGHRKAERDCQIGGRPTLIRAPLRCSAEQVPDDEGDFRRRPVQHTSPLARSGR